MSFLEECEYLLAKSPRLLRETLSDLPEHLLHRNEGADTWTPFQVVGHLVHAERADWMPRIMHLLRHGEAIPFPPFDREAHLREAEKVKLGNLLDEFQLLREESLTQLRELHLDANVLKKRGLHPALGPVTLNQLLATWTAHDQAHLVQIHRILARRFQTEVGPWAAYLSVMRNTPV